MLGDQRAGQEGIVLGFLRPERVETDLLGRYRDGRDAFQSNGGKCAIEFHSSPPRVTKGHEDVRPADTPGSSLL